MSANILTLIRIALVPVIVILVLFGSGDVMWWACGLYVVAAITDFLDGWLARKQNQTTVFGTVLDPIADKLLVGGLLLSLVATGVVSGVHVIAAVIILLRELTVSGMREYLAPMGYTMPVSKLAKWKTAAQMLALGLLIISGELGVFAQIPGVVLLWLAAGMTVWTGALYVRGGLAFARELDRNK